MAKNFTWLTAYFSSATQVNHGGGLTLSRSSNAGLPDLAHCADSDGLDRPNSRAANALERGKLT